MELLYQVSGLSDPKTYYYPSCDAEAVHCIHHPDWLHCRVAGAVDKFKQNKLTDFFKPVGDAETQEEEETQLADIEDFGGDLSTRSFIAPVDPLGIRKATSEPDAADDKPLPNPRVNYLDIVQILIF